MLITITVGVLMSFVGYVFGKRAGTVRGAKMMAFSIVESIKADPVGAIDAIKKQYNVE